MLVVKLTDGLSGSGGTGETPSYYRAASENALRAFSGTSQEALTRINTKGLFLLFIPPTNSGMVMHSML